MSALILPSSSSSASQYGSGSIGGGVGGDDPHRPGGHGIGGHGGEDNYGPPVEAAAEENPDEEEQEVLEETPGKKKKPAYDSEKRKEHYRVNNVAAQKALKGVMIDSLNDRGFQYMERGRARAFNSADADRTHFFRSQRPTDTQARSHNFYWKRNPDVPFNGTADEEAWKDTFSKGTTASRWGAQNLKHVGKMVKDGKIVPSQSFKRKATPAQRSPQPRPQPQPQPPASGQQPYIDPALYTDPSPFFISPLLPGEGRGESSNSNQNRQQGHPGPTLGTFHPRQTNGRTGPPTQQASLAAAHHRQLTQSPNYASQHAHQPSQPTGYAHQHPDGIDYTAIEGLQDFQNLEANFHNYMSTGDETYLVATHPGQLQVEPEPEPEPEEEEEEQGQQPYESDQQGQNPQGQNPQGQNQYPGQQPWGYFYNTIK
ncbi:hypothetical protein TWF506_000462 [Arthrobotrys conoides]|uniref:Uncharacterized protein n=1 Tax=Arthrobotrys conoides TaxID=74498 RepID=A0AAN8NDY9_9PEZI